MNPDQLLGLIGSFWLVVPELVLLVAACVLFVGATFRADRNLWAAVALAAVAAAGVAVWFTPMPGDPGAVPASRWLPEVWQRLGTTTLPEKPSVMASSMVSAIVLDRLALFVKVLALAAGFVLVLFSWKEVPDRQAAEYHACLLVIVAGLSLVGLANDLVTLFLALELISIPTYVLMYLPRHDSAAQEAALKYFLLSIFSSALLLFGFSYLYGQVGSTYLPDILQSIQSSITEGTPPLVQVALVMIVAGLGFRITAVPFHFYAPDVYQGTPTVVAALLAYVPKVAGFVALMRLLGFMWAGHAGTGQALGIQAPLLLYILAAVTMTLGNLLGLLQDNLKRLLAYSSVAHSGYMLIGLAVERDLLGATISGRVDGTLFYLVAYGAMTIGAFAILASLSTSQRPVETVDDLAGLSRSHPGIALLMALFLFSLIGIPFTAGFWGKLLLFFGALASNGPREHPWLYRVLALVAAINAAIGAWYYLRVLAVMYLRTPIKPLGRVRSWPGLAAVFLCALVTVAVGLSPGPLSKITYDAVTPPQVAEEPPKR